MKKLDSIELETVANREHKDSMFRTLFSDKEKLLNLYNAINHTNYENVSQIKLNTLQQVVWMGKKNDISFLFENRLIVFIEHQSTINENMPLRALSYAGRVYETLVPDDDLYGTKQTPIPTPEFYVLYNGVDSYPKEKTLRLSDAFIDKRGREKPLEVVVKVININYNVDNEILNRSEDLKDYSYFVHLVNTFRSEGKILKEAIELAILVCTQQDILTEFLKKHGAEVINMLDWDVNKVIKAHRKEAKDEGRDEGREEKSIEIAEKMIQRGYSIEDIVDFTDLPAELIESLKGMKKQ